MIPKSEDDIITLLPAKRQTSRTYRLDVERSRVRDFADEKEAVKQTIYKILNTERYENLIYSWNYGVELSDLAGRPAGYAIPEAQRRITEALTQDDRIESVDAFSFEEERGKVHLHFTVHTIFGDIPAERTVNR